MTKKDKKCESSSSPGTSNSLKRLKDINDRLAFILEDCENGANLQSLSKKLFEELWDLLRKLLPELQNDSEGGLKECIYLVTKALKSHPKKVICCEYFHQLLASLHEPTEIDEETRDQLILLDEEWLKIKEDNLPQIPSLIRFALLQFVNACLEEKPLVSNLKRLGLLRKHITLDMLQKCSLVFKPFFIKIIQHSPAVLNATVEKFLSHIMALSVTYLKDVHYLIMSNNFLKTTSSKLASAYGRLLALTWHQIDDSNGSISSEYFLEVCRDIIDRFIQEGRTGLELSTLPANLLRIIDTWHVEARKANNDSFASMVSDAYRPILWKNLESEHNHIRVNAAELLFKAFPLMDFSSEDANSELFNKQVELMKALLRDDCHIARIIAVRESCNIISHYWSHFSTSQIHALFTIMCKEDAVDVSSATVRRTFFLGLQSLLKHSRPCDYLMEILPSLSDSFHDANQGVRVAILQLLIAIRDLKRPGCDFKKMVTYSDLLSRLAIENVEVGQWLVKLILPSVYTAEMSASEWLKRFIVLIKKSPRAYRNFFTYSRKALSLSEAFKIICEIIARLGGFVKEKMRADSSQCSDENEEDVRPKRRKSYQKEKERKRQNVSGTVTVMASTQDGNALDDPKNVVGLLDIASILWVVHDKSLNENQNKAKREKLYELAITYGPSLISYYKNAKLFLSVITLYGNIPMQLLTANSITLPGFCMKQLKSLSPEQLKRDEQEVRSILMALMKWGRSREIVEQVQLWLEAAFCRKNEETSCTVEKSHRRVKINETFEPNSVLAIYILDCLFKTEPIKRKLLEKNYEQLLELWKYMGKIKDLIVERLLRKKPFTENLLSDDFLKDCFRRYVKMIPLLNNETETSEEQDSSSGSSPSSQCPAHFHAVYELEKVICWAETYFPSQLLEDGCADVPFISTLSNDLLHVCDNMITINMCTPETYKLVGEFTIKLLTTEHSLRFALGASRLAVALNFWAKVHYFNGDKQNIWSIVIPSLLSHMLNAIISQPYSIEVLENFSQDLHQIKLHVGKILATLEDNFKTNYKKNVQVVSETFQAFKLIFEKMLQSLRVVLGREVPRRDLSVPEYTQLNQLPLLAQTILYPVYNKAFITPVFLVTLKQHLSGSVKNILIDLLILNIFACGKNKKFHPSINGVLKEAQKRLNELKTRRASGELKSLGVSLVKIEEEGEEMSGKKGLTEESDTETGPPRILKSLENYHGSDATETVTGPLMTRQPVKIIATDSSQLSDIPESELVDDFLLCGINLLNNIKGYVNVETDTGNSEVMEPDQEL